MKRTVIMLSLVLAMASGLLPTQARAATKDGLQQGMRKLWEDHITWTRLYMVSACADLPDKDATAARLLQNQVDIGDAIKPYFGEVAGAKLTSLLKQHILIAASIIDAAKKGDVAKKAEAVERWNANSDEIATFLSAANPKNWPLADLKMMMRDHLRLTTDELVARLGKQWTADIAAYDALHLEILTMADMLSNGIIAQNPTKLVKE